MKERIVRMSEWISVKERLPEFKHSLLFGEYSDPVYITYRMNNRAYVCPIPCIYHSSGNWYTDAESLKEWVNLDDYDDNTDTPIASDVIAWKPLLEPYREDGET
jgi:hypothetical protein